MFRGVVRLQPRSGRDDPAQPPPFSFDDLDPKHDELAYRIHLWDASKLKVESLLAVTINGSIAYAAFYAAGKEYEGRYITLTHRGRILSRWNAPD